MEQGEERMAGLRLGDIWVARVFAAEFGTSDVQANYSRLYSWMANQFGHMTLGLATTLAFVWIAETVRVLIAGLGPEAPLFAYPPLWATVAGVFGLGGAALWSELRPSPKPGVAHVQDFPPEAHRDRIALISGGARRALLWCAAVALAVLALAVLIAAIGGMEGAARPLGIVSAGAVLALGVVILSKDRNAATLGLIAVAGAVWMALEDGVWVAASLAAAFTLTLARQQSWRTNNVLTALGALGAILYVVLTGLPLDDGNEWDMAFAAALAAVALWWVKEFGSDIPLVSEEIGRAYLKREAHDEPDYVEIEDRYFSDAIWDARTDGAFYVAGAAIGAGVAARVALVPGSGWESGAEFLGLLVFGGIFLWLGRRWAYRQQALDRMAAPSASRLAVFENALQLQLYQGGALSPVMERPLDWLLEFAEGRAAGPGENAAVISHVVVLGDAGSGKSPLGLAIASEAALTSIPAELAIGLRSDKATWRTSRYVTEKVLRNLAARPNRRPTHIDAGAAPLRGGGEVRPASLVVVDDVNLDPGAPLGAVLNQLAVEVGQSTVWLLDASGLPAFMDRAGWAPSLDPVMKAFLDALGAALAAKTGAAAPPSIAVVFAARKP